LAVYCSITQTTMDGTAEQAVSVWLKTAGAAQLDTMRAQPDNVVHFPDNSSQPPLKMARRS
jgi:hypothetical protein